MNALILSTQERVIRKAPVQQHLLFESTDLIRESYLLTGLSWNFNPKEDIEAEVASVQTLTQSDEFMIEAKSENPEPGGTIDNPVNQEVPEDRSKAPAKGSEIGGTSGAPENVDEGEDRSNAPTEGPEPGGTVDDPANEEEDEDK